jgi:hypothetical protein
MVRFTTRPFYPGERAPDTHFLGGWMGSRTSLDIVENRKTLPLSGLDLRPLDRSACSQSLYRLRYPNFCVVYILQKLVTHISVTYNLIYDFIYF